MWTFVVLMLCFVGLLWADALYAADVGRRMAAAMDDVRIDVRVVP
ncbi:hypothetical protein [Actinoplanes sp. NBRC 101535]|nr:hypothetical protein [Actinoplanes sp. NBRC 101535]GLY06243.1 hypothetical protein Acsp01_66220 [Actinoplanes sp. NBRC 101535]